LNWCFFDSVCIFYGRNDCQYEPCRIMLCHSRVVRPSFGTSFCFKKSRYVATNR
jgi:hypothetical protein